ncbi:MAG TPA: biotin--[acetyl-CoA-carboxylase] ligase [Puia sp.]|nr:biotin--[acetyl-CoA-carboxylase] ligase [Puia sp.]
MPHRTTTLQDKTPPAPGNIFTELASVDSTNNYAMAQAHAGKAFHGNVFFAHEQTQGKGQRGKKWVAAPGENIMMSVVLVPEKLPINEQFLLSASIALSCYDLLNKYLPGEISIKWPNDLYIGDRKAGGILIDNILSGNNWKYAIVGIGININQTQFEEFLINPASLRQATGKTFDVTDLARELCSCIEKRNAQLQLEKMDEIIAEYNQHLYKRTKQVQLKKGDKVFKTTIVEVTAKGKLITVDKKQRSFDFGEVVWLR